MSATTIFNGYVTAAAVCAMTESGLLDEIHDHDKSDVDAFVADHDLHELSTHGLVDVLVRAAVLDRLQADPLIVAKGQEFDDFWRNKGYFLWLVRGYGEMLSKAGELCADVLTSAERMTMRDGAAIARAGKDYGGEYVDPVVDGIIADLDFTCLADLGCGSANRIIRLARAHPGKRFLGVERDTGAVAVARRAVEEAGLATRITIVHDDVQRLLDQPEYGEVDATISFFLGHDFWPRESCLDTLALIRRRMPAVRNFLLSDTYVESGARHGEAPVFTLGFELTHALMGQRVPTADQWCELFEDSAWRLERRTELGIAHSEVFHLVPALVR
ncbi:class I SAM-dependent methyltransferase [Nonomuraea angiospora]|uniref:class I SAM-dependent methyltransferase n=1 Tax=Nonomuraea angiospora TaxID=46172 RepID=UPI0033D0DBCC